MKILLPVTIVVLTITSSCGWFKQKAKETTNKTGEIVAKSGAEFIDGVSNGVRKTFENKVVFTEQLTNAGISAGKLAVSSTEGGIDNKLEAYLIFDKAYTGNITCKVYDAEGKEYGRTSATVTANVGDAQYVDFVFDVRTNIEGKGKIQFQ